MTHLWTWRTPSTPPILVQFLHFTPASWNVHLCVNLHPEPVNNPTEVCQGHNRLRVRHHTSSTHPTAQWTKQPPPRPPTPGGQETAADTGHSYFLGHYFICRKLFSSFLSHSTNVNTKPRQTSCVIGLKIHLLTDSLYSTPRNNQQYTRAGIRARMGVVVGGVVAQWQSAGMVSQRLWAWSLAAPPLLQAHSHLKGLQTESNDQIRSSIRLSLVAPWSSVIGFPTIGLPAVIASMIHLLIRNTNTCSKSLT